MALALKSAFEFLRARPNVVCVRGNYDKNVALFPEREDEYRKKWGRVAPGEVGRASAGTARPSRTRRGSGC